VQRIDQNLYDEVADILEMAVLFGAKIIMHVNSDHCLIGVECILPGVSCDGIAVELVNDADEWIELYAAMRSYSRIIQ